MKNTYLLFLFFLITAGASAQTGRIKGTVAADREPTAFASIGLAGTAIGTASEADGSFELKEVPAGSYKLQVRAVGFAPYETTVTIASGETVKVAVQLRPQAARLREVVVSGTMRETFSLESPVPVEVYTSKYFQKNPTPALFEALAQVNGVQPQINCNVCGTGDIHINGMEGAYTMVLIDGMPMVSALATVYGLSGIPNSMIERVEVVKGPASTLYGSEAMAGLINVITKSPAKAPLASADIFYTSHGELNTDLAVSHRWKKVSSLLSTNYYRFQKQRDVNHDNFTDVPLQHRISVFNKWAFQRQENRLATVAARYYYEDRFGGELQWSPAFRGGDSIYGESVYTRRYELLGAYQLPVPEHLVLSYSFNNHNQNAAYGETLYKGRQSVLFGQLVWDKELNPRHHLVAGATYRHTYYDDNTPATEQQEQGRLQNRPAITRLPGIFVQDELKLSAATTMLAGLRYDYNSEHGSILTPRLNLKWAPNDDHIFRVSLGKGYRVVNLFTEDHAALTGAREVVIKNELKPEESYNATLNYQHYLNLPQGYLNLEGSAFYTYFTNKIVADFLSNNYQIIYDNLSGHAVSRGVALNAEMAFTAPLRVHAGVTLQEVYQVQQPEGQAHQRVPQLHAPAFSGTFTASYTLQQLGLVLDYTGTFSSPMHLPVQENDYRPDKSPWFTLQHLQLTKSIGSRMELYGGVKNLFNFMPQHPLMRPFDPFDKQVEINNPNNYSFDTEYNYAPLQGRRTFFGLRYTLAEVKK
ncbi:TonB-dependent receptor [Pontibacter qinzhouensis]|uniref:TonB-dependent receptor n=1 Tax=Pontibacter qinzhouensis TaxID=2603253 RepID=A0A5C8KEB5_9BACT|nr:TonB-dependent receptor [Pontibacter qinzhouensis]TXK50537.1 TonB-dependent receptor [Pontibacter qinzhouensis]